MIFNLLTRNGVMFKRYPGSSNKTNSEALLKIVNSPNSFSSNKMVIVAVLTCVTKSHEEENLKGSSFVEFAREIAS